MSKPTCEAVVEEYLRPEGSHEPVVYTLHAMNEHVVASLATFGTELCCDIYPDGNCRVYIYHSIDEIAVATSRRASHSIASDLLDELLCEFDFKLLL